MLNNSAYCTIYLSMCFNICFNASCIFYSFAHKYLKVKQRSDSVLSTSSTKIYNGTNMFELCVYICARLICIARNGKHFATF